MKLMNLFVVLCVCLCFDNSHNQLTPDENKDSSALFDVASQIFMNHFASARKLTFRYPKKFVEVTRLIEKIKIPITINAEEGPIEQGVDVREPSEVIFFLEESADISKRLNNTLWTTNSHFVLAFKQSNNTEKSLKQIFEIFKVANVVNVIALVATSDDVLIYSYTTFNYQDCDSVKLILLGAQFNELFPENRLNDYNGCILNASVVNWPPMIISRKSKDDRGLPIFEGTEIGIVLEVSNKMNFTPRFELPKDGEAWGWINPTPRGAVGEVYFKQTYFAIGHLTSTVSRYVNLDITVPVSPSQECITSMVPIGAAKSQATWIEIYVTEFSWLTWCCIFFFFVLASFTFWSISNALGTFSFCSTALYMFSTFISVSVKTPRNTPLRLLFLGWIWYSLIVVLSYETLMGSKLTVSYRLRDIDTLKDLLDSNLHIIALFNVVRLFSPESEGDIRKLASRLQSTTMGISEAIELIARDRNISYLRTATSLQYYTILNPQVRGKVHFMKECFYEYYPVMLLQKRSPLTKITNQIITQLFESGILSKWRQQYMSDDYRYRPSGIRLTLRHMAAPFLAWIVGLALSTLSFTTENFYYRFMKRTT